MLQKNLITESPFKAVTPRTAVEVKELTLQFEEDSPVILNKVNLELHEGEMLLLLGPSGSGKSTIALCLNGIYPQEIESCVTGSVKVWDRPISDRDAAVNAQAVGILFQDVDSQFCMLTVEEEVAFCLENIRCPQSEINERIDEALEMVGLSPYRNVQIHTLSGGMKQHLAIACALALRPEVLVLDEPTANLDPVSTQKLAELITLLRKKYGMAVLLIEHQLDAWMMEVDRVALMNHEGCIVHSDDPRSFFSAYRYELDWLGIWIPGPANLQRELFEHMAKKLTIQDFSLTSEELIRYWNSRPEQEQQQVRNYLGERVRRRNLNSAFLKQNVVLDAKEITFSRKDREVIHNVSLRVQAGEFIAVTGPNGAGKSTLAGLISGLLTPHKGRVMLGETDIAELRESEIRKRVGLVFQHPEHQFVTDKVSDEVSFGLRLQGLSEEDVQRRTSELLAEFRLSDFADSNPYTLSQGQKRRLSVASMLVEDQQVLICDEPTYGQDAYASLRLMEALKARVDRGLTVIMITHDMEWVQAFASRVIVIRDGRVELDGSPAQLWAWSEDRLSKANLMLPIEIQLERALGTYTETAQIEEPGVLYDETNAIPGAEEALRLTSGPDSSKQNLDNKPWSRRMSWSLHEMNPSVKALAITLGVIMLSLAFDPITQLSALILTIVLTAWFGNISWRRWLLLFTPFIIMALGYVWTAIVFPRENAALNDEIWIRIGSFEAGRETVLTALSLGVRTLAFSALSLMFILTTDPVKLMFSLMQQCKLSPKLAYGILAGYRFLPLFKEELTTMQQAHRMRGIQREKGLRFVLYAFKRYSIPLLASSIRKSERVAVAMVSRGFTGERNRDFYVKLQVKRRDWIFLLVLMGGIAISFVTSYLLGYLEWYAGQL
ncbi:energy-coupling factor transporter ATPase [Neobacillus mesonae]|nr:energy-coupling factor transporter ATPase [Neobacillus mesonae]